MLPILNSTLAALAPGPAPTCAGFRRAIRVGAAVWMPFRAVCLLSLTVVTTSHVLAVRYWLKMAWVDAGSHAAKMIQFLALRDWANVNFVTRSMRAFQFVCREQAISVRTDESGPKPTAGKRFGRDKAHEAFDNISSHSISLGSVVRAARCFSTTLARSYFPIFCGGAQ